MVETQQSGTGRDRWDEILALQKEQTSILKESIEALSDSLQAALVGVGRMAQASKERFSEEGKPVDDPMNDLLNLKHVGSLKEFQREFEELLNRVHLPQEEHAVSICLNNLQEEVSIPVRMFHPKTLQHVFALAKNQEAINNRAAVSMKAPLLPTPVIKALSASPGVPPYQNAPLTLAKKASNQQKIKTIEEIAEKDGDLKEQNEGNTELLSHVLSKGVDVNFESDVGTPLNWAAGHGQVDAVKSLLEHGANPNAQTEDDATPLLSAVAARSLTCTELLIQASVDMSIMAGDATPLHVAADFGSVVWSTLLRVGANANISADGVTPLYVAASNGNTEILNALLNAGANPNVTDKMGQKPIQLAASGGNDTVVEIIFPLTSKVETIPDWSVGGIIKYMHSEVNKEKDLNTFQYVLMQVHGLTLLCFVSVGISGILELLCGEFLSLLISPTLEDKGFKGGKLMH